MDTYNLYQELIKPFWAPPAWLFGPVWMVLYALILISFGTVFYKICKKKLPIAISLPFALNIVFNIAFTNIQFGLQNNILAAIDILLVLGTIIWMMVVIYPKVRWIAYVQIPYLAWVAFATVLQLTITYLNW
ncbi:MAG: TspO/MBR family protein [Patescibacteria group bacterium]